MPCLRGAIVAIVASTALFTSASASAAVSVSAGGRVVDAEVCGNEKKVPLHLMQPGPREIVVSGARRAEVRIERCVDGAWKSYSKPAARRRSANRLRARPRLPAGVDLRVTAVSGRSTSSPLYIESVEPGTPGAIIDLPLSFDVQNLNRSRAACPSDGQTYRLNGHLVAPASILVAPERAVTLHLHEFGFGEWFWRFEDRTYDYATQQALSGHASVVIDRLGYDSSPGPNGNNTCLGAHADMANQVVQQLRGGKYELGGAPVRSFAKVALAGHSLGGSIAEILAYSFGGVDALVLFGWADSGFSSAVTAAAVQQSGRCADGGEPAEPGRESGYEFFASEEESPRLLFNDADPSVIERAKALRNRDPCGDANSNVPTVSVNRQNIDEIKVPILLVFGDKDAGFSDPKAAAEGQKAAYTGSPEVTVEMVPNAGHAITLERAAPKARAVAHTWLRGHGF
ncbi:MAG: alpha/beta hydrolase [Actinomycetota bacterium]|nr:alpha/beta hydrolase [Actinomycetota bacterium]